MVGVILLSPADAEVEELNRKEETSLSGGRGDIPVRDRAGMARRRAGEWKLLLAAELVPREGMTRWEQLPFRVI